MVSVVREGARQGAAPHDGPPQARGDENVVKGGPVHVVVGEPGRHLVIGAGVDGVRHHEAQVGAGGQCAASVVIGRVGGLPAPLGAQPAARGPPSLRAGVRAQEGPWPGQGVAAELGVEVAKDDDGRGARDAGDRGVQRLPKGGLGGGVSVVSRGVGHNDHKPGGPRPEVQKQQSIRGPGPGVARSQVACSGGGEQGPHPALP